MRILAFASEFPPYRGGIGTYAANLATAATELGAAVCVVAPDYRRQDLNDGSYPFELIRFPGGIHSSRNALSKLALTRRQIRRGNWDVVHAMDWPFFIPIGLTASSQQKKLFTIHGSDVLDMTAAYKRVALRLSGAFSGDATIIGNSSFTANLFRKHFAREARLTRYELLGVNGFWLGEANRNPARRAELGLPEDVFVIATVGRVVPRKGHLTILKALSLLPAGLQDRVFHAIIGPAVDLDYSRQLDAAIAVSACRVHRFGVMSDSDLRDMYANSDVLCLVGEPASDRSVEGFGLVYVEAGAQSCPSIAGDIGGVAEVVEHERSGLVVPVSDACAVAAAIQRLMEDPGLLKRLRNGARTRAETLSMQRCAAATYGLG